MYDRNQLRRAVVRLRREILDALSSADGLMDQDQQTLEAGIDRIILRHWRRHEPVRPVSPAEHLRTR